MYCTLPVRSGGHPLPLARSQENVKSNFAACVWARRATGELQLYQSGGKSPDIAIQRVASRHESHDSPPRRAHVKRRARARKLASDQCGTGPLKETTREAEARERGGHGGGEAGNIAGRRGQEKTGKKSAMGKETRGVDMADIHTGCQPHRREAAIGLAWVPPRRTRETRLAHMVGAYS